MQPLKNAARLRFADEWRLLEACAAMRLLEACAAMIANARDVALFALAALDWYLSHACQPLAMHLSMS